jgi:dUTP diphosphatase
MQQEKLKVKIKRLHPDSVLPTYAKEGDAGMDLTAVSYKTGLMYTEYGTGLSIEIPEGYVGLIFPRSSVSNKCQSLSNAVGVIDSGYRGEIKLRFDVNMSIYTGAVESGWNEDQLVTLFYTVGERIGQLIIVPFPKVKFEDVDELSETERGVNGFGSTTFVKGDITNTNY